MVWRGGGGGEGCSALPGGFSSTVPKRLALVLIKTCIWKTYFQIEFELQRKTTFGTRELKLFDF